jgi:proteic killer suppression protein
MLPEGPGPTQVSRGVRGTPREVWRTAQPKLKALDVAATLADLTMPSGNRLEPLKGAGSGRHSIRVNDRFRLTFRWERGDAYEVIIEDYH